MLDNRIPAILARRLIINDVVYLDVGAVKPVEVTIVQLAIDSDRVSFSWVSTILGSGTLTVKPSDIVRIAKFGEDVKIDMRCKNCGCNVGTFQ